ncbi:MAG: Gfo/Idh/MocA family oxidoreductase [Bifidobacteriaceae bacterium]|jgi:predicted dehydrogenase|nr:Gfo/Idh/MocA family oxidoreductase [Bifidobacteriaceae bacterium]
MTGAGAGPFPVTLAVIGAGARGGAYARIARDLGARIVAVADPDPGARAALGRPAGATEFASWEALLGGDKLADAVVIATPDRLHLGPALAAAAKGYDILLEKPMAPTEAEARQIVEAVEAAGVIMAVCHVLRYTPYTRVVKELVDSGKLGRLVSVSHLEPVGWWHFAHSYVRGNWRREAESSSMLLAKSSHDLDWISHITGQAVKRIASFGSLMEFRPENKPVGAADRCVDCAVEAACPFSAPRIYGRFLGDPVGERWPLGVLARDPSPGAIEAALREGPYGRCVYNGDNDVVDHQVVALSLASGATVSFTVAAFTQLDFRKTRLFGARAYAEGDGRRVKIHDFLTNSETVIDAGLAGGASAADGHGGADDALIAAFLRAVTTRDRRQVLSGPRESLDTHRIVWTAERARVEGRVVDFVPSAPTPLHLVSRVPG